MDDIDRRVLAVLAESPNVRFVTEEEMLSLCAMSLYIERLVSDVYDMAGGGMSARITEAGRRELARTADKSE